MENQNIIRQCFIIVRCLDRDGNWNTCKLQGKLSIPKAEMNKDEIIDFYSKLGLKIAKDYDFRLALIVSISN